MKTFWSKALFGGLAALSLFALRLAGATDAAVPFDPQVRSGRLANGFTYFIRQNHKPEKRVELRLAVNAGSLEEDNDQLGLAHLVEHMCFRGTKSFPKNDLIHYLQSVGSNFGPDVNAFTSFDETVYQLQVPTDNPETLHNGLRIMREWAHDVNFDHADIDRERGVVIEEWRLGRGAQQRMLDKFLPVVFQDSKYATRLPIGTKESIESMSYDTILRFYHDWYRPDLMALVVVGDVNPDEVERTIRAEFSTLPAAPTPRPKEAHPVPDHAATLYSIVSDRENPYNILIVAFKSEAPQYAKESDFRRRLTEQLFQQLLKQRLDELMQQADPPFVYSEATYGRMWVRNKGAYQLVAVVPDNGVERGLRTLLLENERVRQHGFSAAELERGRKTLLRSLEQRYLDREKTESGQLVDGYVAHFLADDPAPGIEYEYRFAQAHLAEVSLAEVNALPQKWITPGNRVVVVESVEKPGVALPAQPALQAVVQAAAATAVEPWKEKALPASLLAHRPAAGKVVARKVLADIGAVELTFANGVRAVLKPTDFKNDEILIGASRPGGQSVFPDDCNLAAQFATDLADENGVAEFSRPDLQKMLAGRTVTVAPRLDTYFDTLSGNCAPKDLETALQLTYLTFTAPRDEASVYQSFTARQRTILDNVRSNPEAAFFDEANRLRHASHPRTPGLLPSPEDWAQLTEAKTAAAFRARFGSAAGFTFNFVGAFTEEAITPLLETYLGSLPGGAVPAWRDLGVRMISGPHEEILRHGTDPKSFVWIGFDVPATWNAVDGHLAWSLGRILDRALVDKLRLELGGIYGVHAEGSLQKFPTAAAKLDIIVPCAPENVEKLVAATYQELARLRRDGVRPDELQKEIEAQRRALEKEQKENGAWLWKLDLIERHGEDYTRLSHPEELIARVTPAELQRIAAWFDPAKAVRFTMLPVAK